MRCAAASWTARPWPEKDTHVLVFRKTPAERLAKIDAAAEISFPKLRAAREAAIA